MIAVLLLLAAGNLINPYRFSTPPPSTTYEGFEGTGSPSLWTDASTGNTVNWDSTTSPIAGAQSLLLADSTSGDRYIYYDFPVSADQIWVAFRFKISADPATSSAIFGFEDSTGTDIAGVRVETAGDLRVRVQATNSTQIIDLTPGTVYRLKARYVRGTGSNETLEVWCNSDSAGSWSLTQIQSNGTSTAQAGRIYFYVNNPNNHDLVIDNVMPPQASDISWAALD